ncbi:hypothetical protein, partial [Ralstonia pseudosolanacearum]|uniref:hypothetical protein n=1 Tax=Ralstonia pseudosolanacearum TaxID=1310165 RepID=UPI001FFBF031
AETLTAQLAVYNHFASSNEKCRSGLTERHYTFGCLFSLLRRVIVSMRGLSVPSPFQPVPQNAPSRIRS